MEMVAQQNIKTMSSREIAELTNKEHRNVKRDIQVQLGQLGDVLKFEHIYLDGLNRQQTEYRLPRRECEILITGYDVVRRAAVIDRWMELELKQRQELPPVPAGLPDFTNPPVAAMAWAEQYEGREKALAQIEADRPKVEFAESLKSSTNDVDITTAARRLGIGRNKFHSWLRDNHVITLNNLPRQVHVDSGKMRTDTYSFEDANREKRSAEKAVFTPDGFIWIEKKVRQHYRAA